MQIGKCASCKATVKWVRSGTTGKWMILDAEPVEGGRIGIVDDLAWVDTGDMFNPVPPGPRYHDHHVTCPDAKAWSEKAKARKNKGMK